MPELNSLEQFNKMLIGVGNEPTIARGRGEEIEDVAPPSPEEFMTDEPGGAPAPSASGDSPSEANDFFAKFSGSEGEDDGAGAGAEAGTGAGVESTADSFSSEPAPQEPEQDDLGDINIAMDDFGLGDLAAPVEGDDLPDAASLSDDAPDGFGLDDLLAPAEGDALPDAASLSDDAPDGFGLDDLLAPAEGAPPSGDNFDLDDLASTIEETFADGDALGSSGDAGFDIPSDGDVPPESHLDAGEQLSAGIDTGGFGDDDGEFSLDTLSAEDSAMDDEHILEDAAEDAAGSAYAISDEKFAALKDTLDELPFNLRIEIARIITSQKYDEATVRKLIEALIAQQSALSLAQLASRISGKRITLPRSYGKRKGLEFEKEQESFAYRFRETIWPVLRLMLVGTISLIALVYFGFNYIYEPLVARNLYVRGLENITLQEYEQANRLFDQAYEIWPAKRRFLDYARSFKEERQFALAREKYEELLSDDVDPLNREAILEFSNFSTYDLRDYETSLEYLDRLLEEDVWDYDALLSRGNTYLEWGIQFDSPERRDELFEQARFTFASLIDRYGQEDALLFRMLRYFILTRNIEDALELKDLFLDDEKAVLDPYGMTDLAGFLLDLNDAGVYTATALDDSTPVDDYIAGLRNENGGARFLDDAKRVIDKAMALNDEIPETHYYLARHSRELDDIQVEIQALKNARELYDELRTQRPLNRFEASREIDTYIRDGEVLYRLGEILSAETRFRQAIDLYEQARAARRVKAEPRFGRVYAALGDIYYYQAGDYQSAKDFYLQARENRYGSINEFSERFQERQEMAYKLGFINLFQANALSPSDRRSQTEQQDLLDTAISEFNQAEGAIPTANFNLLYARANTQYMRQNYNEAVSLYRILLDELTTERASISTFLLEEDDQHKALIDFQIRTNNNLGVALYRLYQQGGENADTFFAQSQLFLSRSSELAENLARDPETAVRAETRPLAYLNLTTILAPQPLGDVQIDPDIRKDLAALTF